MPFNGIRSPLFSDMFQRYKYLLLVLLLPVLTVSCDSGLTGDLAENLPPSTKLTVNEINLPPGERLLSQINISWWGDDPDGYVVGYEFFIGEGAKQQGAEWKYTTRTDSIFVLPIQQGSLDADVRFTVRAIDNEGARDPNPPSIVFPIRNSPPNVNFNNNELPPDSTFNVFTFGFRASDPDGNANLARIEIALSDTSSADSWKPFDPTVNLLTFRADAQGNTTIFIGRPLQTSENSFSNLQFNSENTFYIRSIDNAAAVSEVKKHTWYVKEKTSNILFLNDYAGPQSTTIENLHLGLLQSIGIGNVDYINISDGQATGGRTVPLSIAFPDRSLRTPTINMMLAEWDHIYWISDNLDRNLGYALELTIDFFNNGGSMFINVPTKVLFEEHPVLDFLPFERVQTVPPGQQTFIIQNNSIVTAATGVENLPYLRFRRNLLATYPIVPFGQTLELFEAPFRTRNVQNVVTDYPGSNLIAAMNPGESILFLGIDMSEFDPNPRTVTQSGEQVVLPASELSDFLRLMCIDLLRFSTSQP